MKTDITNVSRALALQHAAAAAATVAAVHAG
jgi:hypothetical protein